ncbi:MAG TPA: TetR/AcrR family transcriptional regulator [Acidimicrobiales bacterium]|nr:TetR/AcrR family transcriptional regulator [Acidimicrobiales bacterium]
MTESTSTRLSVTDWISAGLELLGEDGIGGVKIQKLCDRLGVTKGSFYWHFTDLDAFLGAMAKHYEDGARIFRDQFTAMARQDPDKTLSEAVRASYDNHLGRIERAMRDWARSDERARAAIEASDRLGFAAIAESFELLGFTPEEADIRAKTLFYAGVGFGDVGPGLGNQRDPHKQLTAMMELLTRR